MEYEIRTYVKHYGLEQQHINHNFLKAGIHRTFFGFLYIYKCDKCGEVKTEFRKKLYNIGLKRDE